MKHWLKNTSGFKYVGLALTAFGIFNLIGNQTPRAEIPLLVGLYVLLITRHKREDERAVAIKNSSTFIALILGYALKLLSANLYEHELIAFQLTEINHFLILVFALAILLFYGRLYMNIGKVGNN